MRRLTPLASFSASALRLAPPMTMAKVWLWCSHSSLATPKIWRASSRVGETTIAPVPAKCERVGQVELLMSCRSSGEN